MSYLYDNHLGGFYSTEFRQVLDDLICEECGDSDWEIGEYETVADAWTLLKDRASIFGTGGYALDYVCSFLTGINRIELQNMSEIQLLQLIESAIDEKLWRTEDA